MDDDLLDGPQVVTITASANGYKSGSDTLDVTDCTTVTTELVVRKELSTLDEVSPLPESLTTVAIGASYFVEIWIQDQLPGSMGITGGTVDVNFPSSLTQALAIDHSGVYTLLTSGSINNATGQIDDIGGGTLTSGIAIAPMYARLGAIEFQGDSLGTSTFTVSAGGIEFGRFLEGAISSDDIDFTSTVSVEQIAGAQLDLRVVTQPTSLATNGEATELPANKDTLHEWEPFWAEIWVSTPDGTGVQISSADVDLALLYNAASLFIMPSLYEGFGLPVLEALACGTPVVASNVSSIPEVMKDAGILVDPYDTDSICDGMFRVLTDDKLQEELREKSLKRAAFFSWEKTARSVLSEYETLMAC